jgi:hypothetical protein
MTGAPRPNKKGGLRRPQFTSCYRFFAFFLDDFALRFLAICFPLQMKERTFPHLRRPRNAIAAKEI